MLKFHQATLANGLEVIAEENPDSYSMAAGLFVKTGSRDESAKINGVSHFLEHMMFKGSQRYTWADVNRIFDEIGARYNAFTTQEMTAYYANVLPEFTERAIEHLAQLLRPAIRQSDFDDEKKVILEEIAMYLDDPGHRLYEKVMSLYFGPHALGQSILGSADSIRALGRDEMATYFATRYGPGNMVLSVTGRLEFDRIKDLAQRFMGDWPHVDAPRAYVAPAAGNERRRMTDAKLNRQYVMGLTPGPAAQDERRFAAQVLADVIGDADGSRLYWALVDNAIAEEADFGFYPHDRCGSYYLSLVCEPSREQRATEIALAELRRTSQDLDAAEVDRAKNKIASELVLSGEVPIGRMRSIGAQWTYNKEYRSLEQDMKSLNAVTPDSLRQLMQDFPFEPITIVSLGPQAQAPAPAPAAANN
jgi:predicted Zn-dependent peptidase